MAPRTVEHDRHWSKGTLLHDDGGGTAAAGGRGTPLAPPDQGDREGPAIRVRRRQVSSIQRLWNVVRRTHTDDDLEQELDTHLALIEEEGLARGLSADEARQEARLRFGNLLVYRERALDAIVATWVTDA